MADDLDWAQLRLAAGDLQFVLLHHAVSIAPQPFARSEIPTIVESQNLLPGNVATTPGNMRDIADRLGREDLLQRYNSGAVILFAACEETRRVLGILMQFVGLEEPDGAKTRRRRVLNFDSSGDVGMAADLLRTIQSLKRGDHLDISIVRRR